MTAIQDVIIFAKRNGGIVTTHEAIALGLPKSTLSRRVDDGVFVRVGRGVLALPGTATRPDLAMRAAMRVLNGVVSHESAARVHGFEPIGKHPPTITVSHRSTHSFAGVVVHQSTDLLEEHIETINGVRTTNAVRTLVDLAGILGRQRLDRVVEHAVATGKVDIEILAELTASLARRGKKGVTRLRDILDGLMGTEVTDSELERLLFQMIDDAGLPLPTKQFHAPWLKPRNGRVDFAYADEEVVIEADGRRWHLKFDAFENDRARDNAAQIAGWLVLRVTWRMMTDDPSSVVSMIRTALNTRSDG